MTTVAVYGPNLRSAGEGFHVHAQECRDCHKPLYTGYPPMIFDPDEVPGSANETLRQTIVREIYADILAEDEGSYAACSDDVKIFPCVRTSGSRPA